MNDLINRVLVAVGAITVGVFALLGLVITAAAVLEELEA